MKTLMLVITASLAIAGGTARAQETKGHEHNMPPAATEQKADENGEHKEMCPCCKKDGMAAMQDKMKGMMKEMPGKMKDSAKENK